MKRTRYFNFTLFAVSAIFFVYLFFMQCIKYRHYAGIAEKEHQKKIILCGTRGNIYDRNGLPLATSDACFSIFCTPRYSPDKKNLARELSVLTRKPRDTIARLVDEGKFFWVEKKVDLAKKEKYLALDDPGLGFAHDLNREYSMQAMFESLIGSCGSDNQGIEGLELYFNDYLVGKSGFVVYQKDPTGEIFPYYNYPEKKPEPGSDIYLTIDLQMQTILYSNLKEYMAQEEAVGAAGLIVQPHTGEILALVNIRQNSNPRNTVVCDEFEPGSTFKLTTLTYALLKGAKENDMINTDGGKIEINGHRINDFRNYGVVSLRQAIAHSSNVAMVKIARGFDRRDFFMLIQDFGFTQPTGLEFPGEVKGHLADPESMRDIEYATLAFGQGVTCNLLQLAFAYQAIANGGVLQKPLIVREIKQDKQSRYHSRPLRVRRVVDDDIAQRVTSILCSVVEEGSGAEAQIDGLKIAGKTGTAQKVIDGVYSNSQIITTFVGFFPADEPEYLIAVMLDEPKKGMWASTIAAPIFKRVAQSLCQMNGVDYAAR